VALLGAQARELEEKRKRERSRPRRPSGNSRKATVLKSSVGTI